LSDSCSESVDSQVVNVGEVMMVVVVTANKMMVTKIGSLGAKMKVVSTWQLFVLHLVINHLEIDKVSTSWNKYSMIDFNAILFEKWLIILTYSVYK
jgi:hypothetical protein